MKRRALLWALATALPARAQEAGPLLELNRASQAELEALRGIGPALSERLLAARAQRPFDDWADLLRRVAGVGPAQAARWSAAGLRVNGQPWAGHAR